MKKIIRSLMLLAFALGIMLAFAFQPASFDHKLFGQLPNGQWEEAIAGQYTCESSPLDVCTARFTNDDPVNGTMIENSETLGEYTPVAP